MTIAALAAVLLMATSPTQPEDIATLQGELRTHSEAAKTEGRAGMQALSTGDTATGCAALRKSDAEIVIVRDLLARWRNALNLSGGAPTDIILKQQKIDEMDGAWIATQGQVQGAITKYCKG